MANLEYACASAPSITTTGLTPGTLDTTILCPVGAGATAQCTVMTQDTSSLKSSGLVVAVTIENPSGTTSLAGTPNVISALQSDGLLSGMIVTAIITASGTLGFTVTGLLGLTLRWNVITRVHQHSLS